MRLILYLLSMPNGGPDNCGTCGFNRRNQGIWRNPSPDESKEPFCEIRNVLVMADYWTYCQNWHTRTRHPVGPIYTSGLFERGYWRIPWHGALEPEHIQAGICTECNEPFAEGLAVLGTESKRYEFCSNLHYLNWWKRQHPDEEALMSNSIWEH